MLKFKNLPKSFIESAKHWNLRWVHENIIIIGDLSETHMPDRKPIGDLEMIQRRLTCPIGDWHAWSEAHRRPTCLRSLIGISTHLNILIFINILGHVGFRWFSDEACRGLRSSMSVYEGSTIGLWWVSDQECQSLICLW